MSSSRATLLVGTLLHFLPAQADAPTKQAGLSPELAQIAAGYAAKVTASGLFVSGRSLASIKAEEFSPDTPLDLMIRPFLRFDVDRENQRVTCSLGRSKATAVLTQGLGCTLVLRDHAAAALRARTIADGPQRPEPDRVDWPLGERVEALPKDAKIDLALRAALDAAFAEPDDGPARRTRAVVIVHRGQLVAERYAGGYDRNTLLPGWSMTKTLVDALVGIRVRQGKLDLDAPLVVPEWPADDPRRALRLPDLLTMTSGLEWFESYEQAESDVLQMLFGTANHASRQAVKPQVRPAGERFAYSSGTTNLICRELRATFATDAEYWAFPRDELFSPLGIHRAVIETDASGTFVGSSYGYATARDWARIGMLYAQDGVFGKKRILPEGWVARAATAVPASGGRYGSQIWLNADPDGDGPRQRGWPELPADLMRLDGHEGQYVLILPTEQLVIARLGCSKRGGTGVRTLAAAILAACRD